MIRIFSRRTSILLIFALTLCAAGYPAAAGELSPPDELPAEAMADYGYDFGSLVTVIVALALIVGLILLTVRLLAYKNRGVFASRAIRNLGGVMVGQNRSVQLLQIGNAVYIIGVGEEVRLIEKIERQEEVDSLLHMLHKPAALPGKGVWDYVRRRSGPASGNALPLDEADRNTPSFHEIFHGKMKQVEHRRKRLKDMLDQDQPTDGKPL